MQKNGKKIRVVGVSRGNEFSPNHVGNDAAIFRETAEELAKRGCEVTLFPEKEFVAQHIQADFIFDMARDRGYDFQAEGAGRKRSAGSQFRIWNRQLCPSGNDGAAYCQRRAPSGKFHHSYRRRVYAGHLSLLDKERRFACHGKGRCGLCGMP